MKKTTMFKSILLVVMALSLLATSLMVPGTLVSAAAPKANLSKSNSTGITAPIKEVISFNEGWQFKHEPRTKYSGEGVDIDDSSWETVTLPHTWWKTATGETNRTDQHEGWYRKHVTFDNSMKGGRVWLDFDAVALYSVVYVNGQKVDTHPGGYTAFRVDITPYINFGEENIIAVSADAYHNLSLPLGGGFNKFPGITGDVSIIYAENVFAALDDCGSPGVFVTPEVTDKAANKWNVAVNSKLTNVGDATNVLVKTTIRAMDNFENVVNASFLDFDPAKMTKEYAEQQGYKVSYTYSETVSLAANSTTDYALDGEKVIKFDNPRLWDGREDPFLYYIDFEIYSADGSKLIDKITQNFGFRYFETTKDGFFLNGRSYPLRGVGYHEDYEGAGSAMTKAQWNESFKIFYEIGANFARLVHYPHQDYSYELCDQYGIVAWSEIALISGIWVADGKVNTAVEANAKVQLKELIRQNKNHPCVVVWGLENELNEGTTPSVIEDTARFMNELHALAKQEDPTRLTTQTSGLSFNWYKWETDVTAFNIYPGWYALDTFANYVISHRNKLNALEHWKDTPLGFAEYGAGGSPNHHSEYPERPAATTQKFHSEEWMNIVHEEDLAVINAHPEFWMTSVWCMFDFACDPFTEGENVGINDKGLVTRDRKTKKDAYYLYQANWIQPETLPIMHITSSNSPTREVDKNTVKAYSNLSKLELYIDGVRYGEMISKGNGIFTLDAVPFGNVGESHKYSLVGYDAQGNEYTSQGTVSGACDITWKRIASEKLELIINDSKIFANDDTSIITYSGSMNVADIPTKITSRYNANFTVLGLDGETVVTSGTVENGMRLKVTAEDGKAQKTYLLASSSIAAGKPVTASSYRTAQPVRPPENAVDGDYNIPWEANASDEGKSWIMVDLEKNYTLTSITLNMFMGSNASNRRKYYYNIYVGTTKDNLSLVVDRTKNTEFGTVTDSLKGVKGRFVKIEFTGNSDYNAGNKAAVISIYELEVNGYRLVEGEAEFDHENKTVTIPYDWDQDTNINKLLSDVKLEGNAYLTYQAEMFYFANGNDDKLIINEFSGNKIEYAIIIADEPPYAGDKYNAFLWLGLLIISGGVLALILYLRNKKS